MPLTDEQRRAIVKESHEWVGTPYRGWACRKGQGADCGQLIYGVYRNLKLIPVTELPRDYSLQVTQHRASSAYVEVVDRYFTDVPEDSAKAGDLVVYKLGLDFAHAAIIDSWPNIIIQAELAHGVSGAHGTKTPVFRRAPRMFRTLKEEFTKGGF